MKGLIGKKLGMTQFYDKDGKLIPVTVVQAGPCTVIDQMTVARNGYSALQLGFGEKKAKNVSKAIKGHCKNSKTEKLPQEIKEIRLDSDPTAEVGSVLTADVFQENDYVDIIGKIKGRGFQGVVKRFHFAGGRASHGGGWHRRTGSIGQKELPGNVIKGKKMPGHMGNVRRTTQNLKVVRVLKEENLIYIKGAVPGPNGGIIIILSARKKTSLK